MPTGNLTSYRGAYFPVLLGDALTLTFTGEDFWIIFTTSTVCKFKVKVDGVYRDTMVWHSGEEEAISDVFDVGYTAGHSYYDGVDVVTSENPSILKLGSPVISYGSHTVIIEMEADGGNVLNFEAIFGFKNSARKNVRDIDTTETGIPLTVELDVEELRNDVVVVGHDHGFLTREGKIINPNNPIHDRTYSHAADIGSLYDHSANHYIGRHLPFEVFNERILSQDRADHIALNALKKYRKSASSVKFSITGDPRLDPYDAIGFTEKKLNTMPEDGRVWIENIEERMFTDKDGKVQYTMDISAMPREPIPSYASKNEPDINNFDGEPLINIELRSRGKRIAGDDATEAAGTVTVGVVGPPDTRPDWDEDMWNDYYVIDDAGTAFKITDTHADGDKLIIDLDNNTYVDGNWSISFDPFDTDQKGAPLEIHYDQVINGKVQIWITDANGHAIARVNKDLFDVVQEWGANKVAYWSGAAEFNTFAGKAGCYISDYSTAFTPPLRVILSINPEDSYFQPMEIDTNSGGTGDHVLHNGSIQLGGVNVAHSEFGTIRIYPRLLKELPLVKVRIAGDRHHANDIVYWGYVSNAVDDGGDKKLTLSPNPNFQVNQYQDYKLCDTYSRFVFPILSNGADWVKVGLQSWDFKDGGANPHFVMIIGQSDINGDHLIHDHFKTTDNGGSGGKIIAEIYSTTYSGPGGDDVSGPYENDAASANSRIKFRTGNDDGFTFTKVLIAASDLQQYVDRDMVCHQYYVFFGGWYFYQLTPGNDVLTNPDFRITADLSVYRIGKADSKIHFVGQQNQIISTAGFVDLDDWAYYLQPTNLVLESQGGETVTRVLQHATEKGWYFLFKFSFMDRAGRYVLNNFKAGNRDNWYGDERKFSYLVGWMPDDNRSAATLWRNAVNLDMSEITKAAIFETLTAWT